MIDFCKTKVPEGIKEELEPLQADEEEVRKFGIKFGIKMC